MNSNLLQERHDNVAKNRNNLLICDCLFYIGKKEAPIPVIGGILAMQSEYFTKLLYNNQFNTTSRKSSAATNRSDNKMNTCKDNIENNSALDDNIIIIVLINTHILKKYSMSLMLHQKHLMQSWIIVIEYIKQ